MKYLVDSFAWIEYFIGSAKGRVVRKIFNNPKSELFTVDCHIAEIKFWALQQKLNFAEHLNAIRTNSQIVETFLTDWLEAAEEKFDKRKKSANFGLLDAMLLVKQRKLNCRILTGDKHFKKLKNVEYLGD